MPGPGAEGSPRIADVQENRTSAQVGKVTGVGQTRLLAWDAEICLLNPLCSFPEPGDGHDDPEHKPHLRGGQRLMGMRAGNRKSVKPIPRSSIFSSLSLSPKNTIPL